MKTIARIAAAAALGSILATAAVAQDAGPQIPTPANPFPANPVATDGTSLLPGHARQLATRNNRIGDPLGGFVGLVTRGY